MVLTDPTQPALVARSSTPYGTARPSSLIEKSCTRTSSGEPFGRHARPAFLKSPTSSFFLVSTEITGSPAASARVTCALMKANCASRSGCAALACLGVGLQAEAEIVQQRADQGAATRWPWACSSSASRRRLLRVQRSGASGSPRAVGSTKASRAGLSCGSVSTEGLRPAPGRRSRPGGSGLWSARSEPAPDGARRQAGDLSHCRDAAIAGGLRFGGGPQAAPPLVEKGLQRFVALPDAVAINHPDRGRPASGPGNRFPAMAAIDLLAARGSRSVATKPQSIPQPEARSLPLNHSIRSFADGP